jgi:UDP-N-acetylmuramoyl-L-alanyl-D-glutamate--2,6-diaminopimelate ligase
MALQQLGSVHQAVDWLVLRGASALATDSRRVRPGDAFIAWPGRSHDARAHVGAALAVGASACLVEADGVETYAFDDERIAALAGLKAAAGPIASRFLGDPGTRLRVVACTGTNGKTSSAWWIAQAMTRLGMRCGVVGTLGIGEPPVAADSAPAALSGDGLTTPDPVALQGALRAFVDAGVVGVAIEARRSASPSIGSTARRSTVALFTNFTQDHLDYHGDMDLYWQAKARLFEWPGLRAAVINTDDLQGLALAERLAAARRSTSGRARAAMRRVCRRGGSGTVRRACRSTSSKGPSGPRSRPRWSASTTSPTARRDRRAARERRRARRRRAACAALTPVPGRMQLVGDGQSGPQVVVDYAHTPDALDKVLAALRPFAQAAAASCGACSAAAATATLRSAR